MHAAKSVISLIAIGAFGVALAQEEAHVKIVVATDDGDGEVIHMHFNSDDVGFNVHDMQEGENQAFVDELGRTILVTREADGYTFDVEGKTIKMPLIDGDHKRMLQLHGDHDENVEVHVEHDVLEVDGDHEGVHEVKVIKKVKVVAE